MRSILSYILICFLFSATQAFASEENGDLSDKAAGKMEETEEDRRKEMEETEAKRRKAREDAIKDFINRVVERETELIKENLGDRSKDQSIRVSLTLKANTSNLKMKKILRAKGATRFSEEHSWLLLASIHAGDLESLQFMIEQTLADPNALVLVHVELRSLKNGSLIRQTSQPRHPLYFAVSRDNNTEAFEMTRRLLDAGSFFHYESQNGRLIFDRTIQMGHTNILREFFDRNFLSATDLGNFIDDIVKKKLNVHEKFVKLLRNYRKKISQFNDPANECPQLLEEIDNVYKSYPNTEDAFYDFIQTLFLIGAKCRPLSGENSVLHKAIFMTNTKLIQKILEFEPSLLGQRDETFRNPIDLAILQYETLSDMDQATRTQIINTLLSYFERRFNDDGIQDHPLSTAFLTAASLRSFNDFEFMIGYLIEKMIYLSSSPSELDEESRTRLFYLFRDIQGISRVQANAVRNIFEAVLTNPSFADEEAAERIKFLIQKKFFMLSAEKLLLLAVSKGFYSVLGVLLNHDTSLIHSKGMLIAACKILDFQKFIEMLRFLLERSIDINTMDLERGGILHYLIQTKNLSPSERLERIRYVLNNEHINIDLEFRGESPLAMAIRLNAPTEIIEELIDEGADRFHDSVVRVLNTRHVNSRVRRLVEGYQRDGFVIYTTERALQPYTVAQLEYVPNSYLSFLTAPLLLQVLELAGLMGDVTSDDESGPSEL